MVNSLFKTSLRTLSKNKSFTLINLLGLVLGLTTCILILLYIFDELSYDRYNINYKQIYRLNTDLKYNNTVTHFAIAAAPIPAALKSEFPEVKQTVRITPALNLRFKKGDENIAESSTLYADPSIFEVFTLPMTEGDPANALTEPNSIVISESAALKYFNSIHAVGKMLMLTTDSSMHKVTGVIHDMPVQSHFRADFFLPLASPQSDSWNSISPFSTYLLLKPKTSAQHLESKFAALMKRHLNTPSFNYDKFEKKGNYIRLGLTPLTAIHLH